MRTETALHHQRLQNIRGMVLLMTVFLLQLLRSSAFETTPGIDKLNRTGKLLPIFSVVRFQNDPCTGNDGKVGTCYTADECSAKGGVRSGVCALGFGQCCVFVAGCGGSSSENCTYFQNNGAQAGECQFEICRCNDNICQLRLDFDSFVISGPSTSTLSVAALFLGEVIDGGGQVSNTGQCLTDSFSVSTPGGANPPTICGINSGQHMYVDASECCNDLTFLLGAEGIDTTLRQRQWSIKITQYSCDYENLAPSGCTQYFFDTDGVETVQTFNFDGGQHLANQNHNFCVRRERGNCKICWTATNDEDFDVSGQQNIHIPDDYEEVRFVEATFMHPNYTYTKKNHDIALVKLTEPLVYNERIQPIGLESEIVAVGTICTTLGWGTTSEDSLLLSSNLRKVDVPVVDDQTCGRAYPSEMVPENMICAGEEGKDSCASDSGGPLLCPTSNGLGLVGLTSYGTGCGRPNYPGVYTEVASYIDWVNEVLQNN